MCGDEYIGRALNAHGPENFSIEVLWVALSEADAYAQEDSFIEEHRTHKYHGGFNIADGGSGWTSEDFKRWFKTPKGRAWIARRTEMQERRAGYPTRRVLAELKKGPCTRASLGLPWAQVQASFSMLRIKGHHIIFERGGLYRLGTLEEAADAWASGRALTNQDRVLGLLIESPRTRAELMEAVGMPHNSVNGSVFSLRKRGYNIESRGASNVRGSIPGTYHLIQDKRHPWLHLGAIDLRGAALDDRA